MRRALSLGLVLPALLPLSAQAQSFYCPTATDLETGIALITRDADYETIEVFQRVSNDVTSYWVMEDATPSYFELIGKGIFTLSNSYLEGGPGESEIYVYPVPTDGLPVVISGLSWSTEVDIFSPTGSSTTRMEVSVGPVQDLDIGPCRYSAMPVRIETVPAEGESSYTTYLYAHDPGISVISESGSGDTSHMIDLPTEIIALRKRFEN
ncbi:hypothetical protein [Pseudooceanicola algae]|uniref:Uncharacterized protein n=1 Tax=Pseudooceanicola algae TaxID=1537215 RepID=A0A418SEZ0_9RHOB|nr:hypothetical protein [Pseudooceanicola algae]QPM89048.1 hypothetical protein PSAL_002570 [Pseudooceanicola algae]